MVHDMQAGDLLKEVGALSRLPNVGIMHANLVPHTDTCVFILLMGRRILIP
jgi:hypothetical protein